MPGQNSASLLDEIEASDAVAAVSEERGPLLCLTGLG